MKSLSVVLALICFSPAAVMAQMSDAAIVNYVTKGMSQGKSATQLAKELLARGVSREQIENLLQSNQLDVDAAANVQDDDFKHQSVTRSSVRESERASVRGAGRRASSAKDGVKDRDRKAYDAAGSYAEDWEAALRDTTSFRRKKTFRIYGHDIFRSDKLTFESSANSPTPEDYVLGPGDEVVIDVWGLNEAQVRQTISPEGRIIVSQIGSIDLSGLTVRAAKAKLKKQFARKYSSISSGQSDLSVTLGQNRAIRVNIMGEVNVPGTYTLSSFSSVFHALYKAGGVTEIGSLRNVSVVRGGEKVATVDLYKYLFDGSAEANVSLHDADVILVPTYGMLVTVTGKVKRPMIYEMAEGETVADALRYAGDFTGDAYRGTVSLVRETGGEKQVMTISAKDYASFKTADADVITTGKALTKFANKLSVNGAVNRPGDYEYGTDIRTLSQLVAHAGGLTESAFPLRAQLIREKEDRSREVLAVPLKAILDGNADDVLLRKNDSLVVFDGLMLERKGDITVTGCVEIPGDYPYAEHATVEDVIMQAGGLTDGASSVRVDVSRRINDPTRLSPGDTLAKVFSFSIKDGLAVDGKPGFELQPYDVVAVRRSPGYVEQRTVTIEGEVAFPGEYTLISSDEKISDIIRRAGGPTDKAYLRGGILKREISEYEREVALATRDLAERSSTGLDSLEIGALALEEDYTVGVQLDKAVAQPGSDYDIVLREHDVIVIPEAASTVRVQGEVLYPNTVNYVAGKNIGYYVNQAGGYADRARRSKVYVVYMNGTVAAGRGSKVEPGCEIIVPSKPQRRQVSAGEIFSIGSSAASLATMIITIANLL